MGSRKMTPRVRTIVILRSVPKCLVRGTQVTLQPSVWSVCLGVGGTMYGHGSIASGLRRTGGIWSRRFCSVLTARI